MKGNPVVFIPGNAGSYKQVRSLASIGYQMFMENVSKYQLDYFAVDFNEERGGMFGDVLIDQINFVQVSLNIIRNLYLKSNPSRINISFIIIGHSIV